MSLKQLEVKESVRMRERDKWDKKKGCEAAEKESMRKDKEKEEGQGGNDAFIVF